LQPICIDESCSCCCLCFGSSGRDQGAGWGASMSRVRFMNAVTGEELHLPPHICRRVRTDMPASTLEWYLRYIASLLERPESAIRFVTTNVDGNSCVISGKRCVITGRQWSHTLLTHLQQEADGNILVQVVVDARPINMCGEPIDGGSVHDDV
jgi:hypothetical protein